MLESAVLAYVENLEREGKSSASQNRRLAGKIFGNGTFANSRRFHLPRTLPLMRLTTADLDHFRFT